MGARSYSARVMRFRRAVYANRRNISAGCQVLLLRLSDDMNANAIVSVPRSKLAVDLACPEPRISEWVKQAREAGFLSVVKPARPGRTAVYQGLEVRPAVPTQVRNGVPQKGTEILTPTEVRPAVPLRGTPSTPPTEVVPTAGVGASVSNHLERRSQEEQSA